MSSGQTQPPSLQEPEIAASVLAILANKIGRPVVLSDDVSHLELDSLALAEVSVEIEKAVNIRLDEGILDAKTVGDIVTYATELKQQAQRRAAG
ncbi:MAG: acyl carrier protein [Planctomycetota bacterium]